MFWMEFYTDLFEKMEISPNSEQHVSLIFHQQKNLFEIFFAFYKHLHKSQPNWMNNEDLNQSFLTLTETALKFGQFLFDKKMISQNLLDQSSNYFYQICAQNTDSSEFFDFALSHKNYKQVCNIYFNSPNNGAKLETNGTINESLLKMLVSEAVEKLKSNLSSDIQRLKAVEILSKDSLKTSVIPILNDMNQGSLCALLNLNY